MADERIEVSRVIAAPPEAIFSILRDPAGHVAIDSSGMLQSFDGHPANAVGDTFVVHMDRESLGDRPLGKYDVTVNITAFEQNRAIEWGISGMTQPPIGHRYGYLLAPADGGTRVTSYYDWSTILDQYRGVIEFPIIPATALKATLGILARTVESAGG